MNAGEFDSDLLPTANDATRSRVVLRQRPILSEGKYLAHDICKRRRNISRPPGEMASRLTTNQEIAGSTPAVVIWFIFLLPFLSW